MSAHWKHAATRCAMDGCDRTRVKGRTTCARGGHTERGVSLYGLKPKDPRLKPPSGMRITHSNGAELSLDNDREN